MSHLAGPLKQLRRRRNKTIVIKMLEKKGLTNPVVKEMRRKKNKGLGVKKTAQTVSRLDTRRKLDSYLLPCLASVLDLVSGEDTATSQDVPVTRYCKYSTWARDKFSVEAKLFELWAKLKAIVTSVAETSKRLHKDFGTQALSFTQNGKSFHPTPYNQGAWRSVAMYWATMRGSEFSTAGERKWIGSTFMRY